MKDFIFVTGASGIGKTTLANGLMNEKNIKRNPLINEIEIDVAGKSIGEVLEQSINIIETASSCFDYEYAKPPKEMFYSWVFSNGLR